MIIVIITIIIIIIIIVNYTKLTKKGERAIAFSSNNSSNIDQVIRSRGTTAVITSHDLSCSADRFLFLLLYEISLIVVVQ